MSTLGWIIVSGLAMSSLALVGAVTIALPAPLLDRILLPLVGLAAGSLLGGAFFHMLPEAVVALGNDLALYVWLVAGFLAFFLLEQFLHWHHCHKAVHDQHRPLGYLILLADGLHNFIGGLAVGGAFIVDIRVGVVTWVVAALHEIPQELGDFGVLVHSGWRPRSALAWNLASALTFLVGGLTAYAVSSSVDVAYLLPFAAGNFIYIAAADLLPEITSQARTRDKIETTAALLSGLAILLLATRLV
ncbi:MAG: ZIP family metal transporter [Microthrixaceae bacterium]|nr:ZIP family metal transporter [Microthrixaceae bacterium]MCO5319850.1 ZIP family metal transporter [Microthrixaceae bacterium]